MNTGNPYQILGVASDADEKTIRKAFRELAKKYHPDVNPGNVEAEKKFREINEAYEILSDEGKRRELDERLSGAGWESAGAAGFGGKSAAKAQGFAASYGRMDGMFEEFMGKPFGKKKTSGGNSTGQMDFSNVSGQFADFFGFKPK